MNISYKRMNLKEIKFSVLMPILEREDIIKGFPLALESIINNSLVPDQVLIVVDGPVSKSFKNLIEEYKNKYSLDLLWISKKVGLDKALNLGLLKCKNEIIFRADGDDLNHEKRFEIQLPYFLSSYDIVGSDIDEFNEFGEYLSSKNMPYSNEEIFKMIPYRNPINHMTVAFKKSKVLSVGGYPELFLKGDYGLWIKLIHRNMKFINIQKSLVRATTGERMINDRGGFKYIISELKLQIYLLKYGLTNIFKASIIFFIRSSLFLLPIKIKNNIYKHFLRSSKNN